MRCLLFGICLVASQAGILSCQNPGLRLPADVPDLRQRVRDLLEDPRGGGFPDAIQLVRSLGQAAAPMAWDLHASNRAVVTRRLQALVLAAVAEEDPATLLRAVQRSPVEDRMLACLVLGALERDTPVDLLAMVGGGERLPLRLAVAALAVAPRGAPCDLVQDVHREDPGIVAAALLSGSSLPCDLRPWLAADRRRPHADLVLRGAFLGHLGSGAQAPEPVVEAAQRAFDDSACPQEVREAAALLLGSRAGARDGEKNPPSELHWHSVAAAGLQQPALSRAWLGWRSPGVMDDLSPGAPGRLAVCYALLQPEARVLASLDDPLMTPALADDIALALAMRLLREGKADASARTSAASPTPMVPSRSWLAWARGTLAAPATGSGDERLDAAARVAAEGRLPAVVAARALEDALWMRGSHPRIAVRVARLELVRDLVLSGSKAGYGYPAGDWQARYALRDISRNDLWFEAAVEAWNALSPQALPLPARHRLR